MIKVPLSIHFHVDNYYDLALMLHRVHLEPGMKQYDVLSASLLRRSGQSAEQGFTLLELLVVIAILGLLIGLVAPAALRQLSGARGSVAKQSLERISSILDLYKLDVGLYPSSDQGLAALLEKPAGVENWYGPYFKVQALPLDPWNRPYVYRSPSGRAGRDYDLCSLGQNGNSGGEAPICN